MLHDVNNYRTKINQELNQSNQLIGYPWHNSMLCD